MESWSKWVSLLFRYGTWERCSDMAPSTSAKADKLRLMKDVSLRTDPVTPDMPSAQEKKTEQWEQAQLQASRHLDIQYTSHTEVLIIFWSDSTRSTSFYFNTFTRGESWHWQHGTNPLKIKQNLFQLNWPFPPTTYRDTQGPFFLRGGITAMERKDRHA